MKKIAIKTYGKILTLLFSLLGIGSGCEIIRCEYGVPSAEFIIKGKVTERETKKPIKNIAIIRKSHTATYFGNDTVRTDSRGDFEMKFTEFPGTDHWIFAEDLDGTENGGLYAPDSVKVEWSQMKKVEKGDGNWYDGVFLKSDVNFILTPDNQFGPMYGVMSAEYKEIDQKNKE
jgi:putative lipoprotein (rSAM/lipoprotein system)